jgi:hypothetical protein
VEKANVDVGPKNVDVSERRILDTRNGTAIVEKLLYVVTTLAHPREPSARNPVQFVRLPIQPDVNFRIPLGCSREPQKVVHSGNSQIILERSIPANVIRARSKWPMVTVRPRRNVNELSFLQHPHSVPLAFWHDASLSSAQLDCGIGFRIASYA